MLRISGLTSASPLPLRFYTLANLSRIFVSAQAEEERFGFHY